MKFNIKNVKTTLTLSDLIKYREWAFIEIRIEAKTYFNSSKDGIDGKGVKPLNDIWSRVINNQEAFWDKKQSDQQLNIILSEQEKNGFVWNFIFR